MGDEVSYRCTVCGMDVKDLHHIPEYCKVVARAERVRNHEGDELGLWRRLKREYERSRFHRAFTGPDFPARS